MSIRCDDGVQFGLGLFETICLKKDKPILLKEHLERLNASLERFGIDQRVREEEVMEWIALHREEISASEQGALKLMVSAENMLFLLRHNPYTAAVLKRGFQLEYSPVMRNETSLFTYHKTMNYGDNILEKRRTKTLGIDEVLFLNSKREICEGSTTNVFFVKEGRILTPKKECGLLPGVLRRYVMEHTACTESVITPEEVLKMEECFVTNSLMGIMPVRRIGSISFKEGEITKKLMQDYRAFFDRE